MLWPIAYVVIVFSMGYLAGYGLEAMRDVRDRGKGAGADE